MADFKATDAELSAPYRTKPPEMEPEKHNWDLPENIPVKFPVEWEV